MASTKNGSNASLGLFDPGFVTQTVNFHGPSLLKLLVGQAESKTQILHSINLKAIDYKVFQERSLEIRNGGSRCSELVEFIAGKSALLLTSQANQSYCFKDNDHEDISYKDRYAHQIPIEYLMQVSKGIRSSNALNNHLKRGSIIFVAVEVNTFNIPLPQTQYNQYSLKFLCYDDGKYGYFSDFDCNTLRIGMNIIDTNVPFADQDNNGRWMAGTRLRVEVLEVNKNGSIEVLVGTKGITIPEDKKTSVNLGKVRLTDLPPILSAPDPTIHYISECIEKMDSFKNPQSNKFMASQLNIDLHSYPSLMSSLRGKFPENEMASSLRKAQLCKWAHKSVADGVTHFKKKEHEEAFQCLNKALQIDSENVEALVAKGALLANLGRYQKAVEEFETALKYNPDHQNARKYMGETLVELGKQQEESGDLQDAEKSYLRCLELNADHEVAQTAIKEISRKLGKEPNLCHINEDAPEEDLLSDLLKMEAEFKKKKEEEKNNISQEEGSTVQKQDPATPEKDALKMTIISDALEMEEEKIAKVDEPAPLSPLSQKLALQQNMWHPNPNSYNPIQTIGAHNNQSFNQIPLYPQPPTYNMFSNPPPGWPNFAIPPPTLPPKDSSMDQSYNDKVDEFLKHLEARSNLRERRRKSRSSSKEKKSKSKERSRSRRRSRHKDQKKKKSSHKDSSESSSTSTSSSSSSGSSSSDSDRNISRSRKRSKKIKKRKDNKKKKTEPKPSEDKGSGMSFPNFDDLEMKLNAYYRKMESIIEPEEESDSSPEIKKKDKHSSKNKKSSEQLSNKKSYEHSSNKKTVERSSNKKTYEHSSKKKTHENSSNKKTYESESDIEDKKGSKKKLHSKVATDRPISPKSVSAQPKSKTKLHARPAFLKNESDDEEEISPAPKSVAANPKSKQKLHVHPAFLDNESDDEEREIPPPLKDVKEKPISNLVSIIKEKELYSNLIKKVQSEIRPKENSSSSESSSSRSSSQSSSDSSSQIKRKSHSKTKSKKLHHSYYKSSRSRSRNRHLKLKSRNKHSRSSSRNKHSRSRSSNKHSRARSRNKHSRSGSRNKHSRSTSTIRHSRSRSQDRHSQSRSHNRHSSLKKHTQLKSSNQHSYHKNHSRSRSIDRHSSQNHKSKDKTRKSSSSPTYTPGSPSNERHSSRKHKSKESTRKSSSSPTYTPGSKASDRYSSQKHKSKESTRMSSSSPTYAPGSKASDKLKDRSKSKEREKVENIIKKVMTMEETKPKSPSPKFGYYQNRPFFSFPQNPPPTLPIPGKISISLNRPLLPPSALNKKKPEKIQDAKQIINKYLSNSKDLPEAKAKTNFAPISVVHPQRFGKWLNDDDSIKPKETKGPTLDEYETFLQHAKERKLEQMKERNKAFLKPAF